MTTFNLEAAALKLAEFGYSIQAANLIIRHLVTTNPYEVYSSLTVEDVLDEQFMEYTKEQLIKEYLFRPDESLDYIIKHVKNYGIILYDTNHDIYVVKENLLIAED